MRRSVVRTFGAAILIIAVSMSLHLAYSYVYVMHGLTEGFEIDGVYERRSGRHGDDTNGVACAEHSDQRERSRLYRDVVTD